VAHPFYAPNLWPLRPWEFPEHIHYYVSVDHTEESYKLFADEMEQWSGPPNGQVILIHGEGGCGKSSLRHRCANRLKDWLLSNHQCDVLIIDQSREAYGNETSDQRAKSACSLLIQDLADSPDFLAEDDITRARDLFNQDPRNAISHLTKRLKANNKAVVLLLPSVELSDEVKEYINLLSKPHFAVFLETTFTEVVDHCKKHHTSSTNRPVLLLEVAQLKSGDAWSFVQHRLKAFQGQVGSTPGFVQSDILQYMNHRSKFGVSVSELEKVCKWVYDRAAQQGAPAITFDDFRDYWLMNGR
jgi:hypothetical protein